MNKTWMGKLLNKKEVVSHVKLGKKEQIQKISMA